MPKSYLEHTGGAFDAGESEAWDALTNMFLQAFKEGWEMSG